MGSQSPFQPWTSDESAKNVKTEGELVDDAKLHRENVNHPKHRQTASYIKESVATSISAPGSSSATAPGGEPDRAKESKMDPNKIASMQQFVENTLSQEGRQRVAQLLEAVEALSGAERLLLYLRLPTGVPQHDPLKQPINPLGSRAELQQTVTWIQTHLEVDPDVSLPKQDVYDEYIAHCMSSNMKPLSTADFGKVMKQVYPSVRPRRLGTRGNSRYCYAGLRKKIKLEVPQLPDLGESSKLQEPNISTMRETDRVVCEWAEAKLGIKFVNVSELSRHLISMSAQHTLPGPASASPPPMPQAHATADDSTSRQLIKHLKRKMQTQGTPGRPKKNKAPEVSGESPPSTSYGGVHAPAKGEAEAAGEPYYTWPYAPYAPRAHPPPDYREPYAFQPYPRDPALPINLSADASLDLSTERPRPPAPAPPPPPRLPLPGKKLILETYQSEARAAADPPYLPKKMRATETMGGKLAAARAAPPAPPDPRPPPAPPRVPPQVAILEDPKNLTSRSKSTAAALAREEREAASGARAGRGEAREGRASPDLDGIGLRTGVICGERHSEILTRERVISICNIDKHDLDDYLNEGSAHEHDEELLQYFPRRERGAHDPPPPAPHDAPHDAPHAVPHDAPHDAQQDASAPTHPDPPAFLDAPLDPHDDHSQGKSEKLSQLRELLAKNLKNPSGSGSQIAQSCPVPELLQTNSHEIAPGSTPSDGAFKTVTAPNSIVTNGPIVPDQTNLSKLGNSVPMKNGISSFIEETPAHRVNQATDGVHLYNGHCHNEPQSPTSRTQQYDFVPISEGCHSPGNFHSKSPLGFGQRGHSPSKVNKTVNMCGSLQTSPISHSTAASPFVSPRNTPVPRSRLCPRPIPKLNGRKRRNPLTLGMVDPCSKQFAIPNDQKFMTKNAMCTVKYCQPISAPPSPNILTHYKTHMYPCPTGLTNGSNNLSLNFLPHPPFRDHTNGDPPLSADPFSTEVSQFFQETILPYRTDTFRSQSVPLKQGIGNMGLLSYNNTPVGSVPPTPVPNEFCDFGSLADTCDISRAGLNRETLDKIYDAIDSSNDVLTADATQSILNSSDALSNGCDPLPDHPILSDEQLTSIIPAGDDLLDRPDRFDQTFTDDNGAADNVDEFLKRANSIEFDLPELVSEKSKYYTSRSVPSTPLPYKRCAGTSARERRARDAFAEGFAAASKSVPSTPQFAEERSVFSYSNRDFLINGNSVAGGALASPLHDMLRDELLAEPLTPALLADLDKIDAAPYDL